MPPLPDAAQTVKVDLDYNVGSDVNALTRLHFTYTGSAPATADCVAFAGIVRTSFTTHLAPLMTANSELRQTVVTDLASHTGAQGIDTTAVSGTRAGTSLTAASAVLINYHIARRYRGGKPRSYFPFGVGADLNGPSAWQSSFVTTVSTAVAAFIAGCLPYTSGSTTFDSFVSLSYYLNKALRASPVKDPITAMACNAKPGSQRRRNQH